jgi:predicted membrane protein
MTDIKKLNKLTKKDYLKILIFVVTFLIARTIFSDWEHFKAGLFGF